MELKIKINMDNDAFHGNNVAEITRILDRYTLQISKGGELLEGDTEKLMDSNGQSVGYAIVI
jgi:hypothetical protein